MNPTQTTIDLGGNAIELKARWESAKNCWAVICFTPSFSIRSERLHLPTPRRAFATALVAAYGGDAGAVQTALDYVTGGFVAPATNTQP